MVPLDKLLLEFKSMNKKNESKKTLIFILCQARMLPETYRSIELRLRKPLNADLAFVGSSHDPSELQVLDKYFSFIHNIEEPKSWLIEIDSVHPSKSWRAIAETYPMLLGGTGIGNSIGSGGISMYYREILRKLFLKMNLKITTGL